MRAVTMLALGALSASAAQAAVPRNGGIGFQPAATELAEQVAFFNDRVMMPILGGISVLVLALLVYVIARYNRRSNPKPASFSHNTTVEVVWTALPVLILVVIAAFSFPLLYKVDQAPDLEQIASQGGADAEAAEEGWLTVKAQGHQWYWTYIYPDFTDADGFPAEFVSNPLHTGLSTDASNGIRNLSVDFPVVVPAGRYIRYQTIAADVIHSWTVPSFGIKTDAIPGKLNEGWFKVDEPGVYYGQCSELCGPNHAYMPIEVRVVPQAQFDNWIELIQSGDLDAAAARVATIDPLSDTKFAQAN